MPNNAPGGWRFDLEDVDGLIAGQMPDVELSACLGMAADRPEDIDPRSWSKMRNQGQEGSCQGHAITAAGEGCYYVGTNTFQQFSPPAAYYLTQQHDGIRGDNGSTIAGGMWVASNIGYLQEQYLPDNDRYNPGTLPPNTKDLCSPYKVRKYRVFDRSNPFGQAYDWMSLGLGFISFGILWNVSLDANGFMRWSSGGGGGHANAGMGYHGGTRDSDGYPEYLWGKNSWGDWGPLHGWYKITRATMERFAQDRNTVIVGISDMGTPVPRKINFIQQSVMQ